MENNLDQLVLAKLQSSKGDWQAVAARAQVSYSWLSKFANGHIANPGYLTLTRLHAALTQPPQAATETIAGQGA